MSENLRGILFAIPIVLFTFLTGDSNVLLGAFILLLSLLIFGERTEKITDKYED